jgi:hypothetical protein
MSKISISLIIPTIQAETYMTPLQKRIGKNSPKTLLKKGKRQYNAGNPLSRSTACFAKTADICKSR